MWICKSTCRGSLDADELWLYSLIFNLGIKRMNALTLMIPIALILGGGFVAAFLWATKKGQYDDLETPALKILDEETDLKTLIEINHKKGHISGKQSN